MSGRSVRDRVTTTASRTEWTVLAGLVVAQLLLVVAYFAATPSRSTSLRYTLYPLVWITVGVWAVLLTDRPQVGRRTWILSLTVAVAYFSVLVVLSGLVRLYGPGGAPVPTDLTVGLASPGWGPRITLVTDAFHVVFVPYRVVGFCSLSYLVYVRTADAARTLASGAVGLLSCLGCAFPIVTSLSTGAVGSGLGVSAILAYSVDVSTGVFVLAVALLYWWPKIEAVGVSDS